MTSRTPNVLLNAEFFLSPWNPCFSRLFSCSSTPLLFILWLGFLTQWLAKYRHDCQWSAVRRRHFSQDWILLYQISIDKYYIAASLSYPFIWQHWCQCTIISPHMAQKVESSVLLSYLLNIHGIKFKHKMHAQPRESSVFIWLSCEIQPKTSCARLVSQPRL